MIRTLLVATAILFSTVPGKIVYGVDITNDDAKTHTITIHELGNKNVLSIEPGRALFNVCDKCVVKISGGNALSLADADVAMIVGGKLVIQGSAN